MKIMVLGSGGREHALADCLSKSAHVENVFVIPGNDGLSFSENFKLKRSTSDLKTHEQLIEFAKKEKIDLTVVGPEILLANGLVDDFKKHGLKIFGPSQKASQLESSKVFSKDMMIKAQIPTAKSYAFTDQKNAQDFIEKTSWTQMVVKCDGLASGKGVVVCDSKQQAFSAVVDFMQNDALGFKVESLLIEEKLTGQEVSVFYLCDSDRAVFFNSACDHKRLLDHDQGPNTGGMGAYSPAPFFSHADQELIHQNVVEPLLGEMLKMNIPFQGVLFIGLMKTDDGYKVLEFNTRFGDPETQTMLPLLDEDLAPWLMAIADGELKSFQKDKHIKIKNQKSVHIVMAAAGYPGLGGQKIHNGDEITILSDLKSQLFFAGVKEENQKLKTQGGRILGVTALSDTFQMAREQAYLDMQNINFDGAQYRRDIGERL